MTITLQSPCNKQCLGKWQLDLRHNRTEANTSTLSFSFQYVLLVYKLDRYKKMHYVIQWKFFFNKLVHWHACKEAELSVHLHQLFSCSSQALTILQTKQFSSICGFCYHSWNVLYTMWVLHWRHVSPAEQTDRQTASQTHRWQRSEPYDTEKPILF